MPVPNAMCRFGRLSTSSLSGRSFAAGSRLAAASMATILSPCLPHATKISVFSHEAWLFAHLVAQAGRGLRRKIGEAVHLIDSTGLRLRAIERPSVVLPLDQADPQDQALPRHVGKRRAHSDRGRPHRLSAPAPRLCRTDRRRGPARLHPSRPANLMHRRPIDRLLNPPPHIIYGSTPG